MFESTHDLLTRQTDFLLAQETDAEFLAQVPVYLRALREEPRLAIHMEDLLREATELVSAHEAHDTREIPGLRELRDELVRLAPEIDDSDVEPSSVEIPAMIEWEATTLAAFDRIVSGEVHVGRSNWRGLGRTSSLLNILGAKIQNLQFPWLERLGSGPTRSQDNQRPDLDDPARRLGNVSRRHDHFANGIRLAERTSAGLALAQLDLIVEFLNPPAAVVESEEDAPQYFSYMLRHVTSGGHAIFKAVHGGGLSESERSRVADRVGDARAWVRRLHEELHRRIGTTASRLGLVLRFKHRAEWYDRERLRALADASGPGTVEDRLTAELLRFLFDQGLSPLAKPMVGSLEPDVLDPSLRPAFYIEAKQYSRSGNPRQTIIRSVAQLHDTAGTMRGEPYGVTEAFVVVFRRGGPRYSLPERLPGDGWTTRLVLVDISSTSESGSRAREKPINLSVTDFVSASS